MGMMGMMEKPFLLLPQRYCPGDRQTAVTSPHSGNVSATKEQCTDATQPNHLHQESYNSQPNLTGNIPYRKSCYRKQNAVLDRQTIVIVLVQTQS